MPKLEFGLPQNQAISMGVDRGVLYYKNRPYAWDGFVSVKANPVKFDKELVWLDGRPVDVDVPNFSTDYSLSVFSYPPIFNECLGFTGSTPGVYYNNFAPKTFDISWRSKRVTRLGEGYLYHFLLNCQSVSPSLEYSTQTDSINPTLFNFDVVSIPKKFLDGQYMSYFVVDGTMLNKEGVDALERFIYGDANTKANVPNDEILTRLFVKNLKHEVADLVQPGYHNLDFNSGDDVIGNTTDGLYQLNDRVRITQVQPGIYTYR